VRSYYLEWPLLPKDIEVSRDGRLAVCGNWRGSISIWRLGDPPPMGQELAEARRSYDQKRQDLGPDAPETLQALDEQAALHLDRGEQLEAELLFRQSLERKLRLYDPEHPAALAARKNLARVLKEQKKWAEAVAVLRQSLEVYRHAQGPEHPDVMIAMNDLADALEAQGKRDEADVLCWKCLEGWDRLLGSGHPETHAARRKLVSRLQARGKPVDLEPLGSALGYVYAELGQWDKALAGYARAFETELPKDRELWLEYACLLVQRGDIGGYHKLCGRLLEAFGHSKNEGDLHLLASTCVLAPQPLHHAGQIIALAKQQMDMVRRRGGPYGFEPLFLGLLYYSAGQYQKASDSLSAFLKAHPDGPHDVANWMLMAMTEQRLGHAEKAQTWFSKADLWVQEETLRRRGQAENLATLESFLWRDWLMIQLLHREAEVLIRGKTADPPPQKKTAGNAGKVIPVGDR
jgi:tetratricopeptide (TPR) repeat protein